MLENATHFVPRQDGGQTLRPPGAHHLVQPRQIHLEHDPVQEQERVERLVLGGRGDAAIDGERGEKPGDLGRAHLRRVALGVEEDIALDPPDVCLFGAATVVAAANSITDAVEEARSQPA